MAWSDIVAKWFTPVLHATTTVQSVLQGVPGETKKQVVLDSILAGAQVGEEIPLPQVQGISMLIDVIVQSLKKNQAAGFTPSATAAAAQPAPVTSAPLVPLPLHQ